MQRIRQSPRMMKSVDHSGEVRRSNGIFTTEPLKNGKRGETIFDDPEVARDSSFTAESSQYSPHQRIANMIPGAGRRRLRSNASDEDESDHSSGGSGSIQPVVLRRGVTAGSEDTSDGFSLVDDNGDSLAGSEGLSEGSQSTGSSNLASSTATQPKESSKAILFPASHRAVRGARRCFWLVWFVGTVSVTTSLWAMARNEWENRMMDLEMDMDDFRWKGKENFDGQVDLLQQSWKSRLESKLQAMDALGASMTSMASAESISWPYVSLPDFARRIATLQDFTFWMPLIRGGSDGSLGPDIWTSYARDNLDDWRFDSVALPDIQERRRNLQDLTNGTEPVSDALFQTRPDGSLQAADPRSSYFFPVWQHAFPVIPALVNYDMLSHPQLGRSIQAVVESKQPVFSETFIGGDTFGGDFALDALFTNQTATMFLFYPIFGEFRGEAEPSDLVGILGTAISWQSILAASSLGGGVSSIHVTIPKGCSNETDGGVLLELTGRRSVTVIDSHAKFSSAESTPLVDAGSVWQARVDLSTNLNYYGIELLFDDISGACGYTLKLVQDVQVGANAVSDLGNENDRVPTNIVIGVLVLAFSVALAFLWFDMRVRFRNTALANEAMKSRNIVTSLFPAQVHGRLFDSNLPQSADMTRAVKEVGEAASSQMEDPANNKEYFEVPLKGEDEGISDGDSVELRDKEELAYPSTRSLSLGLIGRNSANHSLSHSNHSASRKTGNLRMEFMARTASLRSMRGIGGGTGAEPTMQQRFLGFISSDTNNLLGQPEDGVADGGNLVNDEPIADLFPDATVMFADISGFTAWSSEREPAQVFKLLETIYRSFDRIARKRKVFKVETIGDCYLCVTGLPEPQPDHAIIMAKFSKECMSKMRDLTRQLEVSLGPETSELAMRFGLHSGPVTAGVLRGEKSRFQLFGDTVNFASRMESTGQRNRIQASQATADLLILAGKSNWIQSREELVNAKGKGQVQTYWIMPKSNSSPGGSVRSLNATGSFRSLNDSMRSIDGAAAPQPERMSSMIQLKSRPKRSLVGSNHRPKMNEDAASSRRDMLTSSQHSQIWTMDQRMDDDEEDNYDGFDDGNRQERLIDWNIRILASLLKRIVAWRQVTNGEVAASPRRGRRKQAVEDEPTIETKEGQTALDEITEIIPLAKSAPSIHQEITIDPESVELPTKVEEQLREYVTMIACMYRDNFFHNFDHASHVLMSSHQLLKRVIRADKDRNKEETGDYTSIIASDPVTQFAVVFCALIHDVDHTGVSNAQLIKEKAHIADEYKNKSVAEQNSLDLAWDLLMSREYRDLQRAIFANQSELERFRQLVVNIILATDIFDKEQIKFRNSRWEKAFGGGQLEVALSPEDDRSLKATIVIEYIMQASDVSHTMQHWHVYQRWNERLFEEMYSAFQVRRGDQDPSIGWYQGELWFFDNYIIPLARKLKECAVFGAASDQFLKYALENRKEWEIKGEAIVEQFVQKHAKSL